MFSALRYRDFRLLWIGQSASVIGDALVVVALALYVTRTTGRPTDVAIVLLAYSLPLVLFVLIGGVIADRLPRQRLIVTTDIARAVLHGTLALLIATGSVRIWHLVIIGLLFSTAEAFFRPAYTGLVPQTVGDESAIQGAQALGGLSSTVAEIASPALATALVLGVGAAAAFALDALTFCVSALLVWRVRPRQRGSAVAVAQTPSMLRELAAGWQAVRERAWVWVTIICFSAALFLALAPFFVLGATVSRQHYGTEAVFGIANVCWGVGSLIGVVIGSRWRPLHPMRTGMIAALWWPPAVAIYAAGSALPVVFAGMVGAGIGIGMFGVWWETALAERIPPELLSRVSAWDWMGSLALLPLGYLAAGWFGSSYGAAPVMVVGGVVGGGVLLLGLVPDSTRNLHRIEVPPPAAEQLPRRPATVG